MEPRAELPRKLNLGAGERPREDALNVDLRGNPDLCWDLDEHPYPLPRDHFEHIFAFDVVEHLADVKAFMEEAHGLLCDGGVLEITTPHFSCSNSYTDPTHRHHLGFFSFDYFTEGHQWSFYSDVRFEIVERQIVFSAGRVNQLIARLARRRPQLYESRFAWIFPAWFLIFKLRALKPGS